MSVDSNFAVVAARLQELQAAAERTRMVEVPVRGTYFANPMTTAGDLIVGGGAGAPGRLAIGAASSVPYSNGSTVLWLSASGINSRVLGLDAGGSIGWQSQPVIGALGVNGAVSGKIAIHGSTGGVADDLRIYDPSGNVWDVYSGGNNLYHQFNGGNYIFIGTDGNIYNNGNTSTLIFVSDERAKDDVRDLEYGLEVIERLRPRRYTYTGWGSTERGKPGIGLVAQEVRDVLPEAVVTAPRDPILLPEADPVLHLDMGPINVAVIGAIQELATSVRELRAENRRLSDRVAALERERPRE